MSPLLWHLVDHTAETEFIFALFHLLLAGLGLLILLRWLGRRSEELNPVADHRVLALCPGLCRGRNLSRDGVLFRPAMEPAALYLSVARPGMQRNDAQRRPAGGFPPARFPPPR